MTSMLCQDAGIVPPYNPYKIQQKRDMTYRRISRPRRTSKVAASLALGAKL